MALCAHYYMNGIENLFTSDIELFDQIKGRGSKALFQLNLLINIDRNMVATYIIIQISSL